VLVQTLSVGWAELEADWLCTSSWCLCSRKPACCKCSGSQAEEAAAVASILLVFATGSVWVGVGAGLILEGFVVLVPHGVLSHHWHAARRHTSHR
jgi:hypothetical protein